MRVRCTRPPWPVHGALPEGVHVDSGPADGHATSAAGVLLAVTVADCVPIYVVDPERRVVALLHAGWRVIASGIMASGVETLARRFDTRPAHLHVHPRPGYLAGAATRSAPRSSKR